MRKITIISVMILGTVLCTACEESLLEPLILGRWDHSKITAEVTCSSLGLDGTQMQSEPIRIRAHSYRKANAIFNGEPNNALCFFYSRKMEGKRNNTSASLTLYFVDLSDDDLRLNKTYNLNSDDITNQGCRIHITKEIDGVSHSQLFNELEEGHVIFNRADSTVYNEGVILLSGSFQLKFRGCEVYNGTLENIECFDHASSSRCFNTSEDVIHNVERVDDTY